MYIPRSWILLKYQLETWTLSLTLALSLDTVQLFKQCIFHEVGHFPTFQNIFKFNFTEIRYSYTTKRFSCFLVVKKIRKRSTNASTNSFFFFFQSSSASQSEAFLFLGLIWQNKFTNSSQKWTIICASNLQVLCHLQVEFMN